MGWLSGPDSDLKQIAVEIVSFFARDQILFPLMGCAFSALIWHVWEERNRRIFQKKARMTVDFDEMDEEESPPMFDEGGDDSASQLGVSRRLGPNQSGGCVGRGGQQTKRRSLQSGWV